MKPKIHKLKYRPSKNNWQLSNGPICGQVEIVFSNICSIWWKKVTCKKCLKLRKYKNLFSPFDTDENLIGGW